MVAHPSIIQVQTVAVPHQVAVRQQHPILIRAEAVPAIPAVAHLAVAQVIPAVALHQAQAMVATSISAIGAETTRITTTSGKRR